MAQTKKINSIVKRVNKQETTQDSSEKRLIVSNSTEMVVQKEAFLNLTETYTYYIVSTERYVSFISSVFKVIDNDGREINLFFELHIKCPLGKEIQIAEALHEREEYPGNKLDKLIGKWALEFANNDPNFLDNFFQGRKEALVEYVETKANNDIGVDFRATKCFLEGENRLTTIDLSLNKLELSFADSPQKHLFKVDLSLLIDSQTKINALARNKTKGEFQELIKNHLSEYFFGHVKIENIHSNREAVETGFSNYIQNVLEFYGRKIGVIQLEDQTQQEPIKTLKKIISIPIKIPEYSKALEVVNQILITRVDTAKFAANFPSNKEDDAPINKLKELEQWLEERVKDVVTEVYFGYRYNEIVENSKELENQVKEKLERLVTKIGYNPDQIVIIPTFDELKLLKDLKFTIDETFITRDQKEVKLKISVSGQGDERSKKIAPYLNEIKKLPGKVRNLVFSEINQYIHTITSDKFYERFDDSEDSQETVKFELSNLIAQKLREGFDVEINYLSFDLGETEIIQRMNDLIKEWHHFEVVVKSLADRNTNTFTGWFRVDGNAWGLWQIYQTQQFNIEQIKERIIAALKADLSVYPASELSFQDEDRRKHVEGLIRISASQSIKNSFGVSIVIGDIDRKATNAENEYDSFNNVFKNALTNLLRDRTQAIADGEFDEADEISRRIEKLSESISDNRIALSVDEKPRLVEKIPTEDNINNEYDN